MRLQRNQIDGKLPRFISQKDKYSCGAVAVINYWKHCGFKVKYSDIRFLNIQLRTEKKSGTCEIYLEEILNQSFRSIKWIDFKQHLLGSGSIIIADKNHYWFASSFIRYRKRLFVLGINSTNNETYHRISINEMKKILKSSKVILCR